MEATVVVTSTGMGTELGKTASPHEPDQRAVETPLQTSLDNFSKNCRHYSAVCGGTCFRFPRHMPVLDSLMFVVALVVAAIPEALSSIVTSLAMGTKWPMLLSVISRPSKAWRRLRSVQIKTGTRPDRMCPQKIYV